MLVRVGRALEERTLESDRRAAAGRGVDLEAAAERERALLHPDDPERVATAPVGAGARVETAAAVAHLES